MDRRNGGLEKPPGAATPHHPGADAVHAPTTRASRPRDIEFVINPRRVLRVLLTVTAILVVLSTAGQAMFYYLPDFPLRDPLANVFYVDREQSLPTLYSSLMLLVGAVLSGVIAYTLSRTERAYVRHWAVLSLLFALGAVDEFVSVHENAIALLRKLLDIQGGPLWNAWVLPGAAAVAVFAVAYLRFLRHLPRSTRRRMWTGGLLFVGGALGVELVGGSYSAVHGQLNMGFVLIATVEETLEMLGAAVILYGLLAYIPVILLDAGWRLRVAPAD